MENLFLQGLVDLIILISILSSIIGCILFSSLNKANRYFIIYTVIGSAIEIFAALFANAKGNNLLFLHINVLLEFSVLTLFFSSIFIENKDLLLKWVFIPGILFIIFNSLFVQNIYSYNSISLTLNGVYLMACSLYFFYQIIDKEQSSQQDIFTKYAVYSIFVIQSISFIVLFFGNYLLKVELAIQYLIWNLRAIIILVVKCLILFLLVRMLTGFFNIKRIHE